MPRTWDDSAARRIATQVAMWAIFALSLGLAGLLVHGKAAAGGVPLMGPPMRIGHLVMRLPLEWSDIHQFGWRDGLLLYQVQPTTQLPGQFNGQIEIFQSPADPNSADPSAYLANDVLGVSLPAQAMAFPGLGTAGVAVDYTGGKASAGVYAAAITKLSTGETMDLAVAVEANGPISHQQRELLAELVQSIKLADN